MPRSARADAPADPTPADLDAAHRWLLAACRSWILEQAGGAASAAWPPLADRLWPVAATAARFHGLEPLLHALTASTPAAMPPVPEELGAAWERAYYSAWIRNTEDVDLVSRVTADCREVGAGLLVLKGPAVIADVYRDVGLRPMVDLDLLCRPDDLPRVVDVLRRHRYSVRGTPCLYQLDLWRADDEHLIELHYDIQPIVEPRMRFLDGAWADSRLVTLDGRPIPVMSLEHQVVFDLAHCEWHYRDVPLKYVVDFAGRLVLRADDLRWVRLRELLAMAGMGPLFQMFRQTLERALGPGLEIPGVDEADSNPDDGARFETEFLRLSRTFGFVERNRTGAGVRRQPTLRKAIAYSVRRLFPPATVVQVAYRLATPFHAWLYMPVHLVKVLGAFVLTAAGARRWSR